MNSLNEMAITLLQGQTNTGLDNNFKADYDNANSR